MSSLSYETSAVMSNRVIPSLHMYTLIGVSATNFDIEFINEYGQTIGYHGSVTCPATSTGLRAIMATHGPLALAQFEAAVGAYIKPNTADICYNTSGNNTTGVPAIPAVATHLRRFVNGTTTAIGWSG